MINDLMNAYRTFENLTRQEYENGLWIETVANINEKWGVELDDASILTQEPFKLNDIHSLRDIPCRPGEYPFRTKRGSYKAIVFDDIKIKWTRNDKNDYLITQRGCKMKWRDVRLFIEDDFDVNGLEV
jgi:hypothetical protein